MVIDPDLASRIRELVIQGNREGTPMHSKLLLKHLSDEGTQLSVRTLRRYLRLLGYHYGKGNRRNIFHDAQGTIDYRNVYLEKRLRNLNSNELPIFPEVFLDESYCHLDHHARNTWVPTGGVVNERGRKPMLVIFGAFVVYRQDNRLEAALVRESVLIWPVKGKARGRAAGGRTANDNLLWQTVPDFVRDSGVAPDFHDYHGNFTADLFEKLFKKLCQTLRDDYGPCHIHMDGAKYHVRKVDPQPTSCSRIADIRAWLERRNIDEPLRENGDRMTKPEILAHIKNLGIQPVFASYDIASEHGHVICKTPPYHCELQPIEQVWGIVKNQIAAAPNPSETELSLRNRLLDLFARVQPQQLKTLWKKTVKNAKDYWTIFQEELEEGVEYSSSETSSDTSSSGTGEDMSESE